MEKRIDELTPAQQARIPEWADRWTEIGLRTGAADREKFEKAAEDFYYAAHLEWHHNVVWTPSPIVLALAAPVAAFMIELRHQGMVHDAAVRHAVADAAVRHAVGDDPVGAVLCRAVNKAVSAAVEQVADNYELPDPVLDVDMVVRWSVARQIVSSCTCFSSFGRKVSSDVLGFLSHHVVNPVNRATGYLDVLNAARDARGHSIDPVRHWAWAVRRVAPDAVDYAAVASVMRRRFLEHGVPSSLELEWDRGYSDFLREVCGLELASDKRKGQLANDEAAKAAFCWTPFRDFVMVSERPMVIHRELINPSITRGPNSHRLHCADGPAIAFQDGWGVYAVHGVRIPFKQRHIVERPETITVEEIETEQNAEIRRVMIDHYGPARYVADSGAQIVCELGADHPIVGLRTARLLRKGVPGDEPIFYADLLDSTPEPDGTVKRYMLRIDPNAYDGEASRNLLAAAASTWRNADGSLSLNC
jgi:hypothetical protein